MASIILALSPPAGSLVLRPGVSDPSFFFAPLEDRLHRGSLAVDARQKLHQHHVVERLDGQALLLLLGRRREVHVLQLRPRRLVERVFVREAVGHHERRVRERPVDGVEQLAFRFADLAARSALQEELQAVVVQQLLPRRLPALRHLSELHLVHEERHCAIQHLARELARRFVHVHGADHEQVLRDGEPVRLDPRRRLGRRRALHDLVEDFGVGLFPAVGVRFPRPVHLHKRIGHPGPVLLLRALDGAQVFGEVLLDRREVHFVQADEERRLGIRVGLADELHEGRVDEVPPAHLGVVAEKVRGIVPVWLHLHHAVVAWRSLSFSLLGQKLVVAGHVGEPAHELALARAGVSRENRKRLRPQCRREPLQHLVIRERVGKLPRAGLLRGRGIDGFPFLLHDILRDWTCGRRMNDRYLSQDHLGHFGQSSCIAIFKSIYFRLPNQLFPNLLRRRIRRLLVRFNPLSQ